MAIKVQNRKRVNLSLGGEDAEMLHLFAGLSDQPMAAKALEYIKQGLEADEDRYWSKLADQRYDEWVKAGKPIVSLEEVWKKHIGSNFPKEFKTKI